MAKLERKKRGYLGKNILGQNDGKLMNKQMFKWVRGGELQRYLLQ